MVVAVVIDGLAEECDFDDAGVGESFALFEYVIGWSVNFRAACEGYDAVGAEFVAAACDADVGGAVVIGGGDGSGEVEEFEVVGSGGES